jgi:hypothetical protein
MHYIDGASEVTITDRDCERDDGSKLWSGGLSVTTGVVMLSDSSGFHYLNVPASAGHVEIDIWADDETNPEWVWIKLASNGHA